MKPGGAIRGTVYYDPSYGVTLHAISDALAAAAYTAMAVDAWGTYYGNYTDPITDDHYLYCHVGDKPTYVLSFYTNPWTY